MSVGDDIATRIDDDTRPTRYLARQYAATVARLVARMGLHKTVANDLDLDDSRVYSLRK